MTAPEAIDRTASIGVASAGADDVMDRLRAARRRCARWLAPPMFALSLLYLAFLAALVVLWVDVPAMLQPVVTEDAHHELPPVVPAGAQVLISGDDALLAGHRCVLALELLWVVFLAEFVVRFLLRDRSVPWWPTYGPGLIACGFPPMRLCARNPDMGGMIWLPVLGWRKPNRSLRARLERLFSVPMILIALAILPVLLIEFGMRPQVLAHRWLQLALHVSLGMIWFAFALEFIVMFSVTDKKLRYCKEHWLDIAIIVLPFISFLRSLRVVRATRLARVARVEQLVRMSRLYRLRGLAMRALRAMLLLRLLNRLLRVSPERQLEQLREQLREKETDVRLMRIQIAELERVVAERRAAEGSPS
ncbi:MAG: ion transporter [Pirellulaceae bacterium]|jgi:voltage-gated potassium channel|nr:ion transporter [Pirellulaceae bacterium]